MGWLRRYWPIGVLCYTVGMVWWFTELHLQALHIGDQHLIAAIIGTGSQEDAEEEQSIDISQGRVSLAVCGVGTVAPSRDYAVQHTPSCTEAYAANATWVVVTYERGEHEVPVSELRDGKCGEAWGSVLGAGSKRAACVPQALVFTYKHDLLETPTPETYAKNVNNTIQRYRAAWGRPGARVRFLDDAACRATIHRVEPRLLRWFDDEPQGMYKADVCRLAALYEEGGYYFDLDVGVATPYIVEPGLSFVTVREYPKWGHTGLMQAFLATTPQHPIVKEALLQTLGYYEGRIHLPKDDGTYGPRLLRMAFDAVPSQDSYMLLSEGKLGDHGISPPPGERPSGSGCCCDMVVHDGNTSYFWTHIAGSKNC